MSIHRRAAHRLYDGTANAAAHGARWAARNPITATCAGVIGAVAVPDLIHREPLAGVALAAGWAWTAWRTTTPPTPTPTDTPTAPTSDDRSGEGQQPAAGEGMSIIKTVRGTARTHPHPDQPNKTLMRWDKP